MIEPAETKYNKTKMLQAMEKTGGMIAEAYNLAGVPRSTYYHWKKTDPEFAKQVDENSFYAKTETIELAECKLIECIKNNKLPAIIFYLKTQAKHLGYHDDGLAPQLNVNMEELRSLVNRLADAKQADH